MKYLFILALIFLVFDSAQADTVCSSNNFYYNETNRRGGARPRPGDVLSSTLVVQNGAVLGNWKDIESGNGVYIPPPFWILFEGEKKIIEGADNINGGFTTFWQTVILVQNDKFPNGKVVGRHYALCHDKWALYP